MAGQHGTMGPVPPSPGGPCDRDTTITKDTVLFMSYNATGADTIKCEFVKEIQGEYNVSFSAIQEPFKTVKSTAQYFREQFRKSHTYTIPAYY